jgi:hypothetical protein
MARIIYVGPSDAVDLIDGTRCENGVPVTVPDWLAKSLLEQPIWRAAPTASSTTPKPSKPAEPEKASN